MTSRARPVRIVILGDSSDAVRALQQVGREAERAEKDLEGFGKGMKPASDRASKFGTVLKAGVVAGAVAAGAAVTAFVSDSVEQFSELEQAVGGTEAVFGDLSGTIDRAAKTSATAMGLSEAEFRTATTAIGGQLKRMTGDLDLAAEQSVVLAQVAADLAATYGGTTAEAVQALGAAFRGEADPAERFNLNLKIGAQNAKAVELGLASSTKEVDDAARAQGLLALIMEQSTDAQGQFAREQETVAGQAQITAAQIANQKAIVGETLQAYKDWGNFLQLSMGKALAGVATGIQELTGDLTAAEAELRRQEMAYGATVNTLEDLAGLLGKLDEQASSMGFLEDLFNDPEVEVAKLRDGIADLVGEMDLSLDEITRYRNELPILAHQLGLNEQQTSDLANVLDRELRVAQTEAMEASRRMAAQEGRTADATEDTTDAIKSQVEAIKSQIEWEGRARESKRRDADATFNLVAAQREAEEAQKEYNEAVKEFGPTSTEAVEAGQESWEKQQELIDAAREFRREAGPGWEDGFRRMMESAGLSEDTIQGIIDKITELEGKIKDVDGTTIDITANIRGAGNIQVGPDGTFRPGSGRPQPFDTGGVVPGPRGRPRLITAHGGETILPTHKRGFDGGGGGITINATFNISDTANAGRQASRDILREVDRALKIYQSEQRRPI